jgi:hypothetical protein
VFGFRLWGIACVSRAVFRVSRKTFAEWDGEEQGRVVGVWILVFGSWLWGIARVSRAVFRVSRKTFSKLHKCRLFRCDPVAFPVALRKSISQSVRGTNAGETPACATGTVALPGLHFALHSGNRDGHRTAAAGTDCPTTRATERRFAIGLCCAGHSSASRPSPQGPNTEHRTLNTVRVATIREAETLSAAHA